MIRSEADITWETILGTLQLQIPPQSFDTMLKDTRGLSLKDSCLVISTPNPFIAEWLEKRMYGVIEKTASGILKRPVEIQFQVSSRLPIEEPRETEGAPPKAREGFSREVLNPKYTFDTFIVGEGNNLAHAASIAAAERPGRAYNPVFIYGGVGLGKTHLLHAIGHHSRRQSLHCIYVTAEQFTNEFLRAIREGQTEPFRQKYRSVDLLLIDDIHFLIGKEQTQEGFFHTFNDLHNRNSQIVLASDRPPRALSLIAERLRSRFEWGLIADIQAPGFETRLAILLSKADRMGWALEPPILELLATNISSNVRELEGSLNRLVAYSELTGQPISLELATQALPRLTSPKAKPPIDAETLLQVVAQNYSLSVEAIKGKGRARATSLARHVTMYLLHDLLGKSLPEVGKILGGKDHSTVYHAIKKISIQLKDSPNLCADIKRIQEEIEKIRYHSNGSSSHN